LERACNGALDIAKSSLLWSFSMCTSIIDIATTRSPRSQYPPIQIGYQRDRFCISPINRQHAFHTFFPRFSFFRQYFLSTSGDAQGGSPDVPPPFRHTKPLLWRARRPVDCLPERGWHPYASRSRRPRRSMPGILQVPVPALLPDSADVPVAA